MTIIRQQDLVETIAAALQYISYYHPEDYITNLAKAYEKEESPAAKDAMAQILINSRMCAEGHRPICQDTGVVNVFLKVGMDVRFAGPDGASPQMSLQEMVDAGVRKAYLDPDNPLRASLLADPAGARKNTRDNTPSVVTVELVPGGKLEITVAAKGGGSEAKSKFAMLNPSDSIVEWVLKTVPTMGAGWCPPGMLGIGIGGTAEKAMLMAKQSLMEKIDIQDLIARGPKTTAEKLRVELYDKVNKLGIGAQGLGGLTTVLDVKVLDAPCHAANLPVAMIPNCAATRHAHVVLDGSGPAYLDPPRLEAWPKLTYDPVGRAAREPGHGDAGGSRCLEAGRGAAAERQAADRPRRGAQAHDRDVESRRQAASGLPQPVYLLRWAGGSGAGRGDWAGGADNLNAHGQVHAADAGGDGLAGDGRQGGARAGGN